MQADFVKGLSALKKNFMKWSDAVPNGCVPREQVESWPDMPIDAFNAFKKFTGLKFSTETRLKRNGGPHIFAVNPSSRVAVCVYRHTRTFGE